VKTGIQENQSRRGEIDGLGDFYETIIFTKLKKRKEGVTHEHCSIKAIGTGLDKFFTFCYLLWILNSHLRREKCTFH